MYCMYKMYSRVRHMKIYIFDQNRQFGQNMYEQLLYQKKIFYTHQCVCKTLFLAKISMNIMKTMEEVKSKLFYDNFLLVLL